GELAFRSGAGDARRQELQGARRRFATRDRKATRGKRQRHPGSEPAARNPDPRGPDPRDSYTRLNAPPLKKESRPGAALFLQRATTWNYWWVFQAPIRATFSAAGPFSPCTRSNSTSSPSASVLKPLPRIAE